jgi:hypothetical protein
MNKLKSNGIVFLLAIATAFLSTGCTEDDPDDNALSGTAWVCSQTTAYGQPSTETITFAGDNMALLEIEPGNGSANIRIQGTYTCDHPTVIISVTILGINTYITMKRETGNTFIYQDDAGRIFAYRQK